MGGASRSKSAQRVNGIHPEMEMWAKIIPSLEDQIKSKMSDHFSHVVRYREYQEFINRPWTWKNRIAWLINKVVGCE